MKTKKYHVKSPFSPQRSTQRAVIFAPDAYHLALLGRNKGISNSILMVLGTRMDENGLAEISIPDLAEICSTTNSYISQGIAELVTLGFIARHAHGKFWLNFSVFKPLSIELAA